MLESRESNVPEFTVSTLAHSLKRTLEDTYGLVRVRGELGRITVPSSGHLYSNIKDENASLDVVCWKGNLAKLGLKPEEGLEVICTGQITSYPSSSKYQLRVETMTLAGTGALLKLLEDRKQKLAAEGLFSQERKKKLPFLPRVIGVVTSPSGAVIRDILHRLEGRFPVHVIVWPVLVQGQGAAEQIRAAIMGFETIAEQGLPRPDIIIVARGGGALEDLMAFNEENVVRAVAACAIPVISAIGHETDTTLCDYAADLRAPTPTGAAEMAVPVRTQLVAHALEYQQRLLQSMDRIYKENQRRLEAAGRSIGDPARALEIKVQRFDKAASTLQMVFANILHKKNAALSRLYLQHPRVAIENAAHKIERWSSQLLQTQRALLRDEQQKLLHLSKMLHAYSFENILQRGFCVVRAETGGILTTASALKKGMPIDLQFQNQQHVKAEITEDR